MCFITKFPFKNNFQDEIRKAPVPIQDESMKYFRGTT